MIISHLKLQNWKNFLSAELDLQTRVFVVGPNASGKSNFLDVFRFLRDIVKDGGGLQKAIDDRGGLSKIRCLSARRYPDVEIEVTLSQPPDPAPVWRYAIGIRQEVRGNRQPYLSYERVWHKGTQVLNRPKKADLNDPVRLTETHLEQINSNVLFRGISKFFDSTLYLHLIPQMLRHPKAFSGPELPGDPFGRRFLERIAQTPKKTRKSRLRKIERALQYAVPHLKQLTDFVDESGTTHLEAVYDHWRLMGAKQREDQFSDGTLRLIGLFWSLLEGEALLLLEEPELSLNAGIVSRLPGLMYKLQRSKSRQIILSTHSHELLSDPGISGDEIVLLTPGKEGTLANLASTLDDVRPLLEGGMTAADAVLPQTTPADVNQLSLFS
jgi:predicted ATPase